MNLYAHFIKRVQDFAIALAVSIILSPVLIIVSLLVKIKLGSPVIFKQKRPGLNNKIFTLYKFRTMTDKKDKHGELLPDKDRMTSFGEWLRGTSLDELPELFNILNGSLAIVGPRPQLVKDLVFMDKEQRKRHRVRPGLTGLAQVNGRNNINWDEKFKFDLKYIRNITFYNDWKIMFQTVQKVFCKEGINTEGLATSEDLGDYLLRLGRITEEEYRAGLEKSKLLINS
ncbi:UDP-galactose phosphate transferase [Lachnospiraceae bacterium]|uniref:sugar transferase n=1 Tax=Extibacter sp. GGCC_0201 TaxID=2731209 RepID=UPI001AA0CF8C|nr:sugar transferase [Extibacter sp. GGCC_0201]MBO1720462.1 sugar transferase [Extibacter sp. GGCC_0201]BDF34545.1 UDP-galactose phosphate transferase [Lachnospiraceae bacterium]BDF38547.1 UDP-galactose phosphate transferase [Lachnospiraceae bacterium]